MPDHSQDIGDRTRAALADLIDLQMSPLGLAAMDALAPTAGCTVLDIGCGAGQTLLQLAERVGRTGRVIGIDLGPQCLQIARARTKHLPRVSLAQDNAARLSLPPCSVDAVYSRFGVMFFDDPFRAFAHFRRMLHPNGRIGFVCWRSIRENELDYLPLDAAALDVVSDMPHASFEQPSFVENVLRDAGFDEIVIQPFDVEVSCGNTETTLPVVTQVGALGKILRDAPHLRPRVEFLVRAALAKRECEARVFLKAATWIVTASAASQ